MASLALFAIAFIGCGLVERHTPANRVSTDAGRPKDATPAESGTSPAFECAGVGGVALRFRYEVHVDDEPPEIGPSSPVYLVQTAGNDVLAATRRTLAHWSRDGELLHRVPGSAFTEVLAVNPLASSALVRRGDMVQHVAANGDVIATLGPTAASAAGNVSGGIVRADFSESGTSLVLQIGHIDSENEHVDAIEIRSLDGTLVRRVEGARRALVGNDDHITVTASGGDVVATDDRNTELWRAQYRATVNLLWGSRNARTIFVHSDSIGFYAGADNSGILLVDGIPNVIPHLSPVGFSPNGSFVAAGQFGTLSMRVNGAEIWQAPVEPELFVDSVSVNDRGQTLLSGTPSVDAGDSNGSGRAFLYDVRGALLARCSASFQVSLVHSAFSFDGGSFELYGAFGVVSYDVQ